MLNTPLPLTYRKPMLGAQLHRDHPLARGLVLASPFTGGSGQPHDLARGRTTTYGGSTAWNAGRKFAGSALRFTAITANLSYGASNGWLPLAATTVLIIHRKTDATNRVSGAFGFNVSTTGTDAFGAHIPFSDGIVYWDFGGTATNGGRITASGLTFGDDVWVFTHGRRGGEIWQNGIRRGTGTFTGARTSTTNVLYLNNHHGQGGDLADVAGFFIWDRQLGEGEVVNLSSNPFQMVGHRLWLPGPYIAPPLAIAPPVGAFVI